VAVPVQVPQVLSQPVVYWLAPLTQSILTYEFAGVVAPGVVTAACSEELQAGVVVPDPAEVPELPVVPQLALP